MAETTVLLIEDNVKINIANMKMLEIMGYDAVIATCLAEARRAVTERRPDIIILDIMLPDGSGLDFLRELRADAATAYIPVIMLTALGTPDDKVCGLSSGADDYLAKPYEYKELAARIEALLRRAAQVPETLTRGALRFDIIANRAFLNGKDLLLTNKEFSLLLLLVKNEGRVLSSKYLYEAVWKQPMGCDDNALKITLSRLRKKLGVPMTFQYDDEGDGYIFDSVTIDGA